MHILSLKDSNLDCPWIQLAICELPKHAMHYVELLLAPSYTLSRWMCRPVLIALIKANCLKYCDRLFRRYDSWCSVSLVAFDVCLRKHTSFRSMAKYPCLEIKSRESISKLPLQRVCRTVSSSSGTLTCLFADEHPCFLEHATKMANTLRHMIFVDQVKLV
jgi:hypothetical protein